MKHKIVTFLITFSFFTLATFNTSYTAANSGSDSQDTEYEIAPGSEEDEQAVYSSSEDAKILETIREIDGCHEEEKHLRIAVPPLELNEKALKEIEKKLKKFKDNQLVLDDLRAVCVNEREILSPLTIRSLTTAGFFKKLPGEDFPLINSDGTIEPGMKAVIARFLKQTPRNLIRGGRANVRIARS
ncbi:hypothetical protein K2X40_03550 [Candidatus Babeliales bacterium]|nr:hypothetical protein [Candidatus Babeliales bacterium]